MRATFVALPLLLVAAHAHAEPAAQPAAEPLATAPRALVLHVPPLSGAPDHALELVATIDAPFAEELSARWRPLGGGPWREASFERAASGTWYALLPAVPPPGLEYYLRGEDATGAEILHFASAEAPHQVRVAPALGDRLHDLDAQRLGQRRNEVAIDFLGHNFGNRYGVPDRFFRGEVAFTHRLWRSLYHLSFGFGTVFGKTPTSSPPPEDFYQYYVRGLRYGFGELRLRPHPSIFLDARLALGVSHFGFARAARGAVTFGKPWRSSVTVGGELAEDIGNSAWVRLQWDTVPPLLMGASVVRTNLPGVEISSAGLYVAYDLSYAISTRLTLRGQLSYGARDGAANLGGGVGTAVSF